MPDKPSLVDDASLRSIMRNATEFSFTTLMWAIWIYLFLPLLSIGLWVVGVPYIYKTLFSQEVLFRLIALLQRLGWGVLFIFLLLRGWGIYNYYVFGKRNRRKNVAEVTPTELGQHFGVPLEDVLTLRQSKEIVWVRTYDDIRSDAENEIAPSR